MSADRKVGVVVQMRLDSSRLPGKALLPLAGTTMAGAVMRRLRNIPADAYILAADDDGARALAGTASAMGFTVFAGPKEDVLERYARAIEAYGLDRVIRATGDNPLVSAELAIVAMAAADATGAEYVGLVGMPVGMGVEVVSAKALLRARTEAREPSHREHVCPYLYEGVHGFAFARPECPERYRLPDARVTVDTMDDYLRVGSIFAELGEEPLDDEVMGWLRRESLRGRP